MLSPSPRRHAVRRPAIAQPFGIVGQHDIGGIGLEERLVMPRAMRLIAVGHLQRAVEGVGMRPRQDGERGDALGIAVGQRPGDAAAPIMAGEMKARFAVTRGRDDRHRIVHQPVDVIARMIARIGPRAGRIAALARRHRAIAHVGQGGDLRVPAMHRFRKAVQQQHQRRAVLARDQRVEGRGEGRRKSVRAGSSSMIRTSPASIATSGGRAPASGRGGPMPAIEPRPARSDSNSRLVQRSQRVNG